MAEMQQAGFEWGLWGFAARLLLFLVYHSLLIFHIKRNSSNRKKIPQAANEKRVKEIPEERYVFFKGLRVIMRNPDVISCVNTGQSISCFLVLLKQDYTFSVLKQKKFGSLIKHKVCVLIPCRTECSVDEVVYTDGQRKAKTKKVKLKEKEKKRNQKSMQQHVVSQGSCSTINRSATSS